MVSYGFNKRIVQSDQVDGKSSGTEVGEYAQGSSPPGLKEPNLFSTKVAQVINEAEYHNSTDLVSKKIAPKVSSDREEDPVDYFMQDHVKNGSVVDLHNEETECLLVDSKRGGEEHLVCLDVAKNQENLVANDHFLTSLQECTDGKLSASGVAEKVEDLHDGVVINNEPVVVSLDQTVMKSVVSGDVSVNETVASPSCSHVTFDLEDPCTKLLSNSDVCKEHQSDGHLEDNRALSKHGIVVENEFAKIEEESTPSVEAKVSSAVNLLGSPGRPEVVDVEAQTSQELNEADALNHVAHEAVHCNELHLQPCSSGLSKPDVLSIGGKSSVLHKIVKFSFLLSLLSFGCLAF